MHLDLEKATDSKVVMLVIVDLDPWLIIRIYLCETSPTIPPHQVECQAPSPICFEKPLTVLPGTGPGKRHRQGDAKTFHFNSGIKVKWYINSLPKSTLVNDNGIMACKEVIQ